MVKPVTRIILIVLRSWNDLCDCKLSARLSGCGFLGFHFSYDSYERVSAA